MILKVHAKYLMDWINSVFVVLRVDILLSTYGNSTDVQKMQHRPGCCLTAFPCAFHWRKDVSVRFIVSH